MSTPMSTPITEFQRMTLLSLARSSSNLVRVMPELVDNFDKFDECLHKPYTGGRSDYYRNLFAHLQHSFLASEVRDLEHLNMVYRTLIEKKEYKLACELDKCMPENLRHDDLHQLAHEQLMEARSDILPMSNSSVATMELMNQIEYLDSVPAAAETKWVNKATRDYLANIYPTILQKWLPMWSELGPVLYKKFGFDQKMIKRGDDEMQVWYLLIKMYGRFECYKLLFDILRLFDFSPPEIECSLMFRDRFPFERIQPKCNE